MREGHTWGGATRSTGGGQETFYQLYQLSLSRFSQLSLKCDGVCYFVTGFAANTVSVELKKNSRVEKGVLFLRWHML